jgi:beta-glucanase (GH16 family)
MTAKMKLTCFLFLYYVFISCLCNAQSISGDPHYYLVWEDNFDNLDSTKWMVANYAIHDINEKPTKELQIYMNDMVNVKDGKLEISVDDIKSTCHKHRDPEVSGVCVECYTNVSYKYRAGWIETKQDYNFKYGYIEISAQVPYSCGLWPAFWTFRGRNEVKGNSSEIDIYEMFSRFDTTIITTCLHRCYNNISCGEKGLTHNVGIYSDKFHTYSVAWTPNKVVWYFDNEPIRVVNENHNINTAVRLILNIAVTSSTPPDQTSTFPSKMIVDYVRVYQLKDDIPDELVVPNMKIANSSKIYLRTSNSVRLDSNFSISAGTGLFIDVDNSY